MSILIKTLLIVFTAVGLSGFYIFLDKAEKNELTGSASDSLVEQAVSAKSSGSLPQKKILASGYHIYQTFNNCAPAALSMAFSYYGISKTQEELASDLRPYNNLAGDNDDKSTPPLELAGRAEKEGLIPYYRPNGDIELLKKFIANDIPVVVRTLLYIDKDYAHYRVIKGYDDKKGMIVQDDSLEGKNKYFSYQKFMALWQPFNYAYLVLVSPDKKEIVESIIGEDLNKKNAWQKAIRRSEDELTLNPNDRNARFNLAVANFYLGDYSSSVKEFEKIEKQLPRHTIWYQIEPIQAYFALGDYDRVFSLSENILNDNNKAFTELYLLRGRSHLSRGENELARSEFEKAVFYNKNSEEAQRALDSIL